MKRLGIDFGSKKIGLAVTDDSGTMAFPLQVVPNGKQFIGHLKSLVEERGVSELVIGHSLDNTGSPNQVQKLIDEFIIEATLHIGMPIHLQPEQYSTAEASQIQGKNQMTDASAATLILDSFIKNQKNS